MKPDVSIVILTYNNYPYTRACLKSIRKCTNSVPYELIIVDNGSKDGSALKAREFKPDVIIENKSNLGFAAGNNQGLSVAKGTWVLFLNNDVIVTPGWLEGLLSPHLTDEKVAASGPLTNRVSGSQLVSPLMYNLKGPSSPTYEMEKFAHLLREKNSGRNQRVARLVGFCMLCRKKILDEIGSFDEIYGLGNFEDDDLCFRMLAAGYHLVRVDDVFIHHWGSISFRQKGVGYLEHLSHNLKIFSDRWADSFEFAKTYIFKWHLHLANEALGAGIVQMAKEHISKASDLFPQNENIALLSARFALAQGSGYKEALERIKSLSLKQKIPQELMIETLKIAYKSSDDDIEWLFNIAKPEELANDEESTYHAVEVARRTGLIDKAMDILRAYEAKNTPGRRIMILKRRLLQG